MFRHDAADIGQPNATVIAAKHEALANKLVSLSCWELCKCGDTCSAPSSEDPYSDFSVSISPVLTSNPKMEAGCSPRNVGRHSSDFMAS